jgi:four helix bundle protein
MSQVQSYKDLKVWQKSIVLAIDIYKATADFPSHEVFGLRSQVRRASVSISSNIAERQSRGTQDFKRFISIAQGSLAEVETQLLIAKELKYLPDGTYSNLNEQCIEIGKMLNGLYNSL